VTAVLLAQVIQAGVKPASSSSGLICAST